MKYRKKEETIDAIQWLGDNFMDVKDFCKGTKPLVTNPILRMVGDNQQLYLVCVFERYVNARDYIVKDACGSLIIVKEWDFNYTYEPIGSLSRFADNNMGFGKLSQKDNPILPTRSVLLDTDVIQTYTNEEIQLREKSRMRTLNAMLDKEKIERYEIQPIAYMNGSEIMRQVELRMAGLNYVTDEEVAELRQKVLNYKEPKPSIWKRLLNMVGL